MRDGFRIVDTDAHHIEPASIWVDYIDAAFRSRAPRIEEYGGRRALGVEGETLTSEGKYPFAAPEFIAALMKGMERFKRSAEKGFDASSRLFDMDEQGVDIQILYPTTGGQMLGREYRDPELLAAICRAYNDWSSSYCNDAPSPQRLRWAAMLPLQAIDLAMEEARRSAAKGCVGYYVRPGPVQGRNLYHEDYYPLWSEVERLGLPICIHDSGSPHIPSYGDRMDSHTSGHILAHPFEAMSAMAGLIWFGIAERFPNLRIVHVEADAGWLPYWIQRMEQHYQFSGNAEHADLRKSPTEYFRQNFFVAARGDEMTLPSVVSLLGDENVVFNTDYPHPDGTWPWGIESLTGQPIPEESMRRIFWDNAARAFGLELSS